MSLINLSFFNKTTADKSPKAETTTISEAKEEDHQANEKEEIDNLNGKEPSSSKETKQTEAVVDIALMKAEEEEEDESPDQTIQTVRVDSDPFHICLSSTNFDRYLIDYLQMHPITKRHSFYILPNHSNT